MVDDYVLELSLRRIINNHKHWLERAIETRALADQSDDAETKRTLHEIASGYDRLAELAKQRKIRSSTARYN
jgi:hypothetical protein